MGNEIGLHGSFDSWKDEQALKKEINRLRGLGIRSIRGVRNHYLQYDFQETPKAQKNCDVSYDSTIGFNYTNGFRAGTCFPYQVGDVWELPFQLMDTALRSESDSWNVRTDTALSIVDEVRRVGGVAVVNWHSQFMNEDCFPENIRLLEKIVERAKRDGAWITLPREVITWWSKRAREIGNV